MKLLLTGLLLCFLSMANATNYYVDATGGNNGNTGTSAAFAWQTISQVNTAMASMNSGDVIYFKRGETFYGSITTPRSGLTFDAYGTGATPVITGLTIVTGWVNLHDSIYEASVSGVSASVLLVIRNGLIQQIGRYPNKNAANGGYLTISASSSSTLTGPFLSSTHNYTGAELVTRYARWSIERTTVTSHSGGVLTSSFPEFPNVGMGYFFQRDSTTLDQDGEWYYNPVTSKLRAVFANNNPSAYTVQIVTQDRLLYNVYGGITVQNLSFVGAASHAVYNFGGASFTAYNVTTSLTGKAGIASGYGASAHIYNCNIHHSLSAGIDVQNDYGIGVGANNITVNNNIVDSIGMWAGMQAGTPYTASAIVTKGMGINVYSNAITNVGYNGIEWNGDNLDCYYNFINGFCNVLDDGGGIYSKVTISPVPTWSNRRIHHNIVINGIGNNNGADDPNGKKANAGYWDENNITGLTDHNIFANCNGAGIIANSFTYLNFNDNIIYNCYYSDLYERFKDAPLIRNVRSTRNVFYPKRFYYTNGQIDSPAITINADIAALGTLDSNYNYLRPGTDSALRWRSFYANFTNYKDSIKSYSYLQGTIGVETHSITVNTSNAASVLQYNASAVPVVYSFAGLSKKDIVTNTVYNDSYTVPAWGGAVLIDNGSSPVVTPPPPPTPKNYFIKRRYKRY